MTLSRRSTLGATVMFVTMSLGGCGGQGSSSSTGPGSIQGRSATLTFRVYNGATGEVPGAGFTRTLDTDPSTGIFPTVSISLAGLPVRGVDPARAALRLPHVGDQVGSLVAKTTSGTLTIQPTNSMTYELFLMNSSSGVDYGCLDYTAEATYGASTAFPTMRRITSGQIFGCPVEDGEDAAIQSAVDQFNSAMNPFGIKYGYITYGGTSSASSNMTMGWTPWAACVASQGAGGVLVVQQRQEQTETTRTVLVSHELAHAYLGAPDYYSQRSCFSGNTTCALFDCPATAATFSEAGKDATRYWALMDARTRGRSFAVR
jgi:hypothetical protein